MSYFICIRHWKDPAFVCKDIINDIKHIIKDKEYDKLSHTLDDLKYLQSLIDGIHGAPPIGDIYLSSGYFTDASPTVAPVPNKNIEPLPPISIHLTDKNSLHPNDNNTKPNGFKNVKKSKKNTKPQTTHKKFTERGKKSMHRRPQSIKSQHTLSKQLERIKFSDTNKIMENDESSRGITTLRLDIAEAAIIHVKKSHCLLYSLFWLQYADFFYNQVLFHKYNLLLIILFHFFYLLYLLLDNVSTSSDINDAKNVWCLLFFFYFSSLWAAFQILTFNYQLMKGICKSFDFIYKSFFLIQSIVTGMLIWIKNGYNVGIVLSSFLVYSQIIGIFIIFFDAWNVTDKVLKILILSFIIAIWLISTINTYLFAPDIVFNPLKNYSFQGDTKISVKSIYVQSCFNLILFFFKPIAREISSVWSKYRYGERSVVNKEDNITQSTSFVSYWWIKFE